jgi:REP element-mobilizing transposase RayT
MPRRPREKDSIAIYHIICRSISETLLSRDDEDKDYYLRLLKMYSSKYKCSVYAYCLMDNHLHIHLDQEAMISQASCTV